MLPTFDNTARWHRGLPRRPGTFLLAYLSAALVMAGITSVARGLEALLPAGELSLIFMTGVIIVASLFGPGPSMVASLLGVLGYNFYFTEPRLTLRVIQETDLVTLGLFLLVSLVTGTLAARLRARAVELHRSHERASALHGLTRQIAAAGTTSEVAQAAVSEIARTIGGGAALLRNTGGSAELLASEAWPGLGPSEQITVLELFGPQSGGTEEPFPHPQRPWHVARVAAGNETLAALAVLPDATLPLDEEDWKLLIAMADQLALALKRTELNASLEAARLTAETERLRSALLSSVSHDLRTPLVSIIGAASVLSDPQPGHRPEALQALADTIREEGERLDRYIQNLLDMTRLTHGALVPRRRPCELSEIIGNVRRRLRRELARYVLRVDLPQDLPAIEVDPILMEQALVNILDNAAKYADAGSEIIIRAGLYDGTFRIEIVDQGPGIPADARAQVFEMFHRVNAGDSQKAGTGLGLAIARGIVEAHGGLIRAEGTSTDKRGTAIILDLPLAEEET
jgi:two-component system sensor histidine kinase KdpD